METKTKPASNGTVKYSPALCFGTFFILLCQSRNNLGSGKRNQFDENLRAVSEADVFNALMRIVYDDSTWSVSSHGEGIYKSCSRNKKVPCQETAVLRAFNAKFDDYGKYKEIVNDVCNELVAILDPSKDEELVRSIISLIGTAVCDDDGTSLVDDKEEFQITATHKAAKWKLMSKKCEIYLPHFLLDVYRYILNNCFDNTVGATTYNIWCPRTLPNAPRPFIKGPDISVVKSPITVIRNIETENLQTEDEYLKAVNNYHDSSSCVKFIRDIRSDLTENAIETKLKKSPTDTGTPQYFSQEIAELEKAGGEDFVTIFGDGGAGKTYMLVNGMDALKIKPNYKRHVLYIPLNRLKFKFDDSDEQRKNENAIDNYIIKNIFKADSVLNWKKHYNRTNGQKLLLLLDGFNEVSDKADRRGSLIYEIDELCQDLNCKVVLTSRPESLIMSNLRDLGKNLYMAELTLENIKDYIDNIHAKEKIKYTGMIVSGQIGLKDSTISDSSTPFAKLLKLCKLPLFLSLYGQTYKYQKNNISYEFGKKACGWIQYDKNIEPEASYILWNYFNREFLKESENIASATDTRVKQIVSLLAVHIFWPRVAFWMQLNNRFDIEPEDLQNNIIESLDWLIANIVTHKGLAYIRNAVMKISNAGTKYIDFITTHLNVDSIERYMSDEQAFFGGQADEFGYVSSDYSFRHQSIRDCFAAMHLLNMAVVKDTYSEKKLFNGWDQRDIFKNTYMRNHLLSLAKINKYSILLEAVEPLRGVYLPTGNYLMENLLIAIRLSGLYGTDGSLVDFNFDKLDLDLCDLIEVKLVNDSGVAANIHKALRMGDNIFIKPAHNKPVRSIAVNKNGRSVVSCADDAVLLWDFRSRKVLWRIFEYKQSVNNRCCFADVDKRVIFTNGKELRVWDIGKKEDINIFLANVEIESVASITEDLSDANKCYYYVARDKTGRNYCWHSDNRVPKQIKSDTKAWIHYTPVNNKLLMYDYNTQQLGLIDWEGNDCGISFGTFGSIPRHITFATNIGLCAFVFTTINNEDEIKIIDLTGNSEGIDLFNRKDEDSPRLSARVTALAFAQSGRWLSAWGNIDGKTIRIYQQKDNGLSYFDLCSNSANDLSSAVATSLALHESIIYYGNKKGKIFVDEVAKDDSEYYRYTFLDNHPPHVEDIAIIPDTNRCIGAYEDGVIREWDYLTEELIRKYDGYHDGPILCVASAHSKSLIASSGVDGRILIWDRGESYAKAKEIGNITQLLSKGTWDVDIQRITCISFTDDDKYVITCGVAGIIHIWSVQEVRSTDDRSDGLLAPISQPLIQFDKNYRNEGINIWRTFLLYSFDGQKRIVIADKDGALFFGKLVYDETDSLAEIAEIAYIPIQTAHSKRIRSLAFSSNTPFGVRVASYGHDEIIKLWVEEANKIGSREEYPAFYRANGLNFSPDGKKLYLSNSDTDSNKNPVMVLSLEDREPKAVVFHDEHERCISMRIKANYDKVISCALDGYIIVSDSNGINRQKLEVKRNLASHFGHSFENYKEEQRSQFIIETKLPIRGFFADWWRAGQLINIFKFINPKYDNSVSDYKLEDIFGIDFLKCTDVDARINMFVRSVVPDQLENESENANFELERAILEVIISYLYYYADADEKNMAMVSILLKSDDLHDLVTTIWAKSARGKTAILIDDYIQHRETAKKIKEDDWSWDTWNDSDIVKPLLRPMFQSAFLSYLNATLTDPLIYDLNTVMSFSDEIIFPNEDIYEDDTIKAQIAFLSLLRKFVNFAKSDSALNEKDDVIRVLDSSIEESITMFINLCESDDYKQYKNLVDDYKRIVDTSNYTALAAANRVIADFYREV